MIQLFLKDTFPTNMPQVVFYENACKLLAHIFNSEERDLFFQSIVVVDACHFKNHKESDCFCRRWTDPNSFPQLKTQQGGWVFNSSAAELTNIWYGKFASICRNMSPVQYEFFLNEMVQLHNNWLCEKLEKRNDIGYLGDIHL